MSERTSCKRSYILRGFPCNRFSFPKGTTAGQTFGVSVYFPDGYDSSKRYPVWLMGSGIGERNSGDLAGCKLTSGWGGWYWQKIEADKRGLLLVWVNTANNYDKGEYPFTLNWSIGRLPVNQDLIAVHSHSLGGYGAGNYAFPDPSFAKAVWAWLSSATGPIYNTALHKSLVDNKVRAWAITAANDTVRGTNPSYTRDIYNKMKALDPNAPVVLTEFPATRWPNDTTLSNGTKGSKNAHDSGILASFSNPSMPQVTNLISKGMAGPRVQNTYDWLFSNPRGSIYQDPSHAIVGPLFEQQPAPIPEPIPTPTKGEKVPIKVAMVMMEGSKKSQVLEITWADGDIEVFKAPSGLTCSSVRALQNADEDDYYIMDITDPNPNIVVGPYKK